LVQLQNNKGRRCFRDGAIVDLDGLNCCTRRQSNLDRDNLSMGAELLLKAKFRFVVNLRSRSLDGKAALMVSSSPQRNKLT
jgi:hypothetical protein